LQGALSGRALPAASLQKAAIVFSRRVGGAAAERRIEAGKADE